ncbi:MAG: glycosyltransferase family 2 protein [Deltaproteobacteria bacterium]|nr:glycosyltransferase family 2 protein [Deltaproteobacteria bacterium]
MPAVSVIIPAYNREKFIGRALESALAQTFRDMEIIVVDDGSSDGTIEVVKKLAGSDSRLYLLVHEKNRGAQAARNTGIFASAGDYIAFLDSDDEWLPEKLERQMSLIARNRDRTGAFYAGYLQVYGNGNSEAECLPRLRGNIYRAVLEASFGDMNTLMVRKDILFAAGLCNERIRAYHEWDLCIRLAGRTDFDYVPEPLARYYLHGAPTISSDLQRSAWGYADVVAAHRDEIVEICGLRALSRHYVKVGHFLMIAGAAEPARRFFLQAARSSPFNVEACLLYGISLSGARAYSFLRSLRRALRPSAAETTNKPGRKP